MNRRTWRDGWTPIDPARAEHGRQLQRETMTRDYASVVAYQRDLVMLAHIGWQIAAVHEHPRHGLYATIRAWWHRTRGHPDPVVTVTYRRLH